MWKKIYYIYGGDENVKRAKIESLKGQFDQMKMKEGENIINYNKRIKNNVSAIRVGGGKIEDETMVSKVLRTLLPIYVIRVLAIQEMRCNLAHDLTLDNLVGD